MENKKKKKQLEIHLLNGSHIFDLSIEMEFIATQKYISQTENE